MVPGFAGDNEKTPSELQKTLPHHCFVSERRRTKKRTQGCTQPKIRLPTRPTPYIQQTGCFHKKVGGPAHCMPYFHTTGTGIRPSYRRPARHCRGIRRFARRFPSACNPRQSSRKPHFSWRTSKSTIRNTFPPFHSGPYRD